MARTLPLRWSAPWQGIRAERYQRELASERDRLRLVLEINNHVSKLDIDEVLRSASTSIRRYFGCESISVWVLREDSRPAAKSAARFSW